MTRLLSIILVALLSACGGGGDAAAPAAAACAPVPVVAVQLFGDSTQAGYEGGRTPSALAVHTPAVGLQEALDARFGRGTTLVTSRAVGGTTSSQLIAGTDGLNQPWPRSVAAHVVVVNHGINDMQERRPLEDYKANLRILSTAPGAVVILETPNRVDADARDTDPYAQAMREVAAERGLRVADTNALPLSTILLGDWAHPLDAGYVNIVTQSLAPAVVPAVAALRCE